VENIIVTGGAGFIAKSLIEHLETTGRNVWSLSRSKATERTFQVDITNAEELTNSINLSKIETIIHVAAHIPQPENKLDLESCQSANFNGTLNLLEFARKKGVQKFIYISSLSMFDNCNYDVIDENTVPSPNTDYSISKLSAEYLCRYYQHTYNMEVTILRLGTIYGLGMNSTRLINYFVEQCINNETFAVYKANTQINISYLKDVLNVVEALISAESGIYHFANESFSKRQLVLAIKKVVNSQSIIEFDTDQDSQLKKFTMSKVEAIINKNSKPFYSFEDGIKEYIKEKFN